jgi:hypothetical protein
MANDKREELEKRVQRKFVEHAVFRWESAVVIALTLVSAATLFLFKDASFVPDSAWMWTMLAGLLAEGGLIASSLTDKQLFQKVMAEALRRDFDPKTITDRRLRAQFEEALDYRTRIEAAIQEQPDGLLKDELLNTFSQIDDWLEHIYNLTHKLSRYRAQQQKIERDKARAQQRIENLQTDFITEDDPTVKKQMMATIKSLQRQLETLAGVENAMQRAQLQVDNSLAHLGTIYSQTLLMNAREIDSGRANRLRQEIAEEVIELGDVLLAMDEVYAVETI